MSINFITYLLGIFVTAWVLSRRFKKFPEYELSFGDIKSIIILALGWPFFGALFLMLGLFYDLE